VPFRDTKPITLNSPAAAVMESCVSADDFRTYLLSGNRRAHSSLREGLVKNLFVAFFFALGCTAFLWAQEPSSKAKSQTLRIDVDLVLVNVTVSDTLGRLVTGLSRENFQLWEDKTEQKIEYFSDEDTALSIGLIFDATGSMSDKLSTARDAAVTLLKTGNPKDEYFLVTFGQEPRLAEDFTTDVSRLQNRLLFTPAKGLTPLFDAVYMGLDKMKSASNKRKALL
jgi:hypothetical protein